MYECKDATCVPNKVFSTALKSYKADVYKLSSLRLRMSKLSIKNRSTYNVSQFPCPWRGVYVSFIFRVLLDLNRIIAPSKMIALYEHVASNIGVTLLILNLSDN